MSQFAVVISGVSLTIATLVFPGLRLSLFLPNLRPLLELAGAGAVLFAALILAVPNEIDVRPARNAFAAALTVLAVSNGVFGVLPVLTSNVVTPSHGLAFYPWVGARWVISALFVCVGLERPRMGLIRYLGLGLGLLAVVEGALAPTASQLPTAVHIVGGPSRQAVVIAEPVLHIILQMAPAALFTLGAWLAGRLYLRNIAREYIWLSLALIVQVFAQIHEILYPAFLGPIMTTADPLRFLSFLLLIGGAFIQLRRVYRSRSTALRAQQRDLRSQQALLEDLRTFAEHEHDFRNIVSHELATPIATIRAYSHVLETSAVADKRVRQAIMGIKAEASRLMELVGRMEELRDLELSEFRCQLRPVRIRPLLEDLTRFAQGIPSGHAVSLRCSDALVEADPVRLSQALRNVLVNAIRYSPPSSPIEIEGRIHDADRYHLAISDEGPGVPVEERQRVLRRYTRGGSGRATEGRGVGLYVASRIAEAHDGSLRIENANNETGTGARVVIELRLAS
ncbi:MAG: ATP-binding protein [Actinomycetota bacterium]|nr:ATP-binding protein [Actinomycetota bacterium]